MHPPKPPLPAPDNIRRNTRSSSRKPISTSDNFVLKRHVEATDIGLVIGKRKAKAAATKESVSTKSVKVFVEEKDVPNAKLTEMRRSVRKRKRLISDGGENNRSSSTQRFGKMGDPYSVNNKKITRIKTGREKKIDYNDEESYTDAIRSGKETKHVKRPEEMKIMRRVTRSSGGNEKDGTPTIITVPLSRDFYRSVPPAIAMKKSPRETIGRAGNKRVGGDTRGRRISSRDGSRDSWPSVATPGTTRGGRCKKILKLEKNVSGRCSVLSQIRCGNGTPVDLPQVPSSLLQPISTTPIENDSSVSVGGGSEEACSPQSPQLDLEITSQDNIWSKYISAESLTPVVVNKVKKKLKKKSEVNVATLLQGEDDQISHGLQLPQLKCLLKRGEKMSRNRKKEQQFENNCSSSLDGVGTIVVHSPIHPPPDSLLKVRASNENHKYYNASLKDDREMTISTRLHPMSESEVINLEQKQKEDANNTECFKTGGVFSRSQKNGHEMIHSSQSPKIKSLSKLIVINANCIDAMQEQNKDKNCKKSSTCPSPPSKPNNEFCNTLTVKGGDMSTLQWKDVGQRHKQNDNTEKDHNSSSQNENKVQVMPLPHQFSKKGFVLNPPFVTSFVCSMSRDNPLLISLTRALDEAEHAAPKVQVHLFRDVAVQYLHLLAAISEIRKGGKGYVTGRNTTINDVSPLVSHLNNILSSYACSLSRGDSFDILRSQEKSKTETVRPLPQAAFPSVGSVSTTAAMICNTYKLLKIQKFVQQTSQSLRSRRQCSTGSHKYDPNVAWDYDDRATVLKAGEWAVFGQRSGEKSCMVVRDLMAVGCEDWESGCTILPAGSWAAFEVSTGCLRSSKVEDQIQRNTSDVSLCHSISPPLKQRQKPPKSTKKKKKKESTSYHHKFTWICTECREAECPPSLGIDSNVLLLCEGPCGRPFHYPCAGLSFLPREEEPFVCDDCTKGDWKCTVCGDRAGYRGKVYKCSRSDCGLFYHESCLGMYEVEINWDEEGSEVVSESISSGTVDTDKRQKNGKSKKKYIAQSSGKEGMMNTKEKIPPSIVVKTDVPAEKITVEGEDEKKSLQVENVQNDCKDDSVLTSSSRKPNFICPAHHCMVCQGDEYGKSNPNTYVKKDLLYRCLECPNSYHSACIHPMAKFHELAILCHEHCDLKLPDLDVGSSLEAELVAKSEKKRYRERKRIQILQKKELGYTTLGASSSALPSDVLLCQPIVPAVRKRGNILSGGSQLPRGIRSLGSLENIINVHFHLPDKFTKVVYSKPPPYIHIHTLKYIASNRPKRREPTSQCKCVPLTGTDDEPCGPSCLNRMLMIECVGKTVGPTDKYRNCACGVDCGNRQIGRRQAAKCRPKREEGRGWGLIAVDGVQRGSLVLEYVGEVIDEKMMLDRLNNWPIHHPNDPDFYIMALDTNWYIDAKKMGNLSRFINHSCDPNCQLVVTNVNGYIRIGIVAIQDVLPGGYLSYDYQFDTKHPESFKCRCGAPNCRGTMQGGVRKEAVEKKTKKQLFVEAKKQLERDLKFVENARADAKVRLNGTGLQVPCADKDNSELVVNGPYDKYKDDAIAGRIFLWRNAVAGGDFYARYIRKVKKWDKKTVLVSESSAN